MSKHKHIFVHFTDGTFVERPRNSQSEKEQAESIAEDEGGMLWCYKVDDPTPIDETT